MRRYDGQLVPISKFLGSGFRTTFLTRFCHPEFNSGFDGVPPPVEVPGEAPLEDGVSMNSSPAVEIPRRNRGYYRLRYNVDPRVAINPDAYVRKVDDEGPYTISNMWTTERFHISML